MCAGQHSCGTVLKNDAACEALDPLLPKLKNENGEFMDDPRRHRKDKQGYNGRRRSDLDRSYDEDD